MQTIIKISLVATVALILAGCDIPSDDSDENSTTVVKNEIIETTTTNTTNINNTTTTNTNTTITNNNGSTQMELSGGDSDVVTIVTDTHPNYTVAKTNGLIDVSTGFNGLTVTVTTNNSITEVSSSTIAIYGKVSGKSTEALLKLNSNYPEDSRFVVKAYRDNKLVAISEEFGLIGESVHFNDI